MSQIVIGDPSVPYFDQTTDTCSLSKKRKLDRDKDLFLNPLLSDATIVLKDGTPIPVHKYVLSAASEPFATMFSDKWTEGTDVKIGTCKTPPFYSLLRFIYCRELVVEAGSLMDFLDLADRFLVHTVFDEVTESVESHINWTVYHWALKRQRFQLRDSCVKLMQKQVFANNAFLDATTDTLCHLLSCDLMRTEEMQLFDCCVKWATSECGRRGLEVTGKNQRLVMQPFIHLIRFPVMTAAFVTTSLAAEKVLTKEEIIALWRYKAVADNAQSLPFNCEKRKKTLIPIPTDP